MRGASKLVLVMAIVLCLAGSGTPSVSAQDGGLTLTPATLTLNLAAGTLQESREFTITNHYSAPVALHFGFEPGADSTASTKPSDYLRISQADVSVGAGESIKQVVTLVDDERLSPGSQLADLVITQTNQVSANVGVLPSIRMPLILVKKDGAVSAITLGAFSAPYLRMTTPGSLDATLTNTGNMIAIPHGFITVTGPNGAVISKGVLNTSSQAVSPGGNLTLITTLNKLDNAVWPGVYRTTISYGLGGGQAVRTASNWYFYIAWWHVVALAVLAVGAYFAVKYRPRPAAQKPATRQAPSQLEIQHRFKKPQKTPLLGRDIV